jgi:DNA invertase Pin-like site-specific DNA recombinase
MQVIAYVRASTEEQADSGAGLTAQRTAIEAECAHRGWKILETIEDAGYSAKNLKRPGIQAALEQLDAGQADGLVVAKLDRLSRSMLDFTALMARAQRRTAAAPEGWALVALDCAVDTTTPAGEAMAHVLATFAQFERRLIGQRTKDALAAKKAQGVRLGRPSTLPPVIVERIVRERSAGRSLAAIASGLDADEVPTAQGGARWYPATIRKVIAAAGR